MKLAGSRPSRLREVAAELRNLHLPVIGLLAPQTNNRAMQQTHRTVAFLLLLAARPLAAAPPDGRLFDVLGYVATVRPDIEAGTVTGDVSIHLRLLSGKAKTIEFDRADLVIDEVRQQGRRLDFDLLPRQVRVHLPAPTARGELRDLAISYHGVPRSGLRFVPGTTAGLHDLLDQRVARLRRCPGRQGDVRSSAGPSRRPPGHSEPGPS